MCTWKSLIYIIYIFIYIMLGRTYFQDLPQAALRAGLTLKTAHGSGR